MRPRHGLPVVLVLLVIVAAAAPAAAQTGDDPPPGPSTFVRDSVLYPNSPDGWACWFLGQCRPPGERTADDPGAIAVVRDGQPVDVTCVFGSYAKVTVAPGSAPPAAAPVPAGPPAGPGGPTDAGLPPGGPVLPTTSTIPPVPAAPTGTTLPPTGTTLPPTGTSLPATGTPGAPVPPTTGAPGGAPEPARPLTAWAPVADVDTPAAPGRCGIDQWAW